MTEIDPVFEDLSVPEDSLILIVDDNAQNLELLQAYLEDLGCRTQIAHDGAQAIEMAKAETPDVMVLDVMMPRMDGATLCEQMRADPDLQTIYFILLSNRSDTSEKVEGLERGADAYLTKTADHEELLARVRK